jgi:Fe-S cluster biogenesis protein NfuA/nitrite reductase/ring-hydroxylating ferredoxin subunit
VDDEQARERVERVETLLDEVESLADPRAQAKATEMVQALLDLYGEGLARVLAHAENGGAQSFPETLAGDELVSHLLLLHDLHPVSVDERVLDALDEVRPYLESHGGDVELLGVGEGVVRLRLQGSCSGCPSSTMTLKLAIEEAIFKAAPEIESVEAEGVAEAPPEPRLIQLPVADSVRRQGPPAPAAGGAWAIAGGLPEIAGGGTVVKRVSGEPVLFLKVDGAPYGYRPKCPGCWKSLANAALAGAELTCAACGTRYDVRRAGRCLDSDDLSLEPVPLLETDGGLVKVAVRAAAVA